MFNRFGRTGRQGRHQSTRSAIYKQIKDIAEELDYKTPIKWSATTEAMKSELAMLKSMKAHDKEHGAQYIAYYNDGKRSSSTSVTYDKLSDIPKTIEVVIGQDEYGNGGVKVTQELKSVTRDAGKGYGFIDIPHFRGSAMIYPYMQATDLATDTCGYDAIQRLTGIGFEQVRAVVRKKKQEGLTVNDLRKFYESLAGTPNQRGLLVVNQIHEELARITYDQSVRGNKRQTDVYMFTNDHIYTPTPSVRNAILKHRDYKVMHELDTMGHEHQATASDVVVYKSDDYDNEGAMLSAAMGYAEQQLAIRAQAPANSKFPTLRINTDAPTLTDLWMNRLAANIGYKSNYTHEKGVTAIWLSHGITIYANANYMGDSEAAKELRIAYVNQSSAQLASSYFERVGATWRHSTPNQHVRKMLAEQYNAGAINYCDNYKLTKSQCVRSVDFYRHYTSVAMLGGTFIVDCDASVKKVNPAAITDELDVMPEYMYYVETDNKYPCQGSRWYHGSFVAKAIELGVIKCTDIKYRLPVVLTPGNDDILKTFIRGVYNTVTNDTSRKSIVNMMIGQLGSKSERVGSHYHVTTHEDTALYLAARMRLAKYPGVTTDRIQAGDKTIYFIQSKQDHHIMYTDHPVRSHIVDTANMQVYELANRINAWPGATVVGQCTDALYYTIKTKAKAFPTVKRNHTFGDIRPQSGDSIVNIHGLRPRVKRTDPNEHDADEWNDESEHRVDWDHPIRDTRQWNNIVYDETRKPNIADIAALRRAFIRGAAGCGKTYIANQLIDHLEADDKSVAKIAYTHVAAQLIKGQTIHSAFGMAIDTSRISGHVINRFIDQYDALVIEEASFCDQAVYRVLVQLPDTMDIYIIGDFNQLECPGEDDRKWDTTRMFAGIVNYNRITLTEQHRADKEYARAAIDVAKTGAIPVKYIKIAFASDEIQQANDNDLHIVYRNKTRHAINYRRVEHHRNALDIPRTPLDKRVARVYKPGPEIIQSGREVINASRLAYVLRNLEQFPQLYHDDDDELANLRKQIISMLHISTPVPETKASDYPGHNVSDLRIYPVHYRYAKNSTSGRLYARKGLSLQSLAKPIRALIAHDLYTDIDMTNSQPTILAHMYSSVGIDALCLGYYLENRDAVIASIISACDNPAIDRSFVKSTILSIINGGTAHYQTICDVGCERLEWLHEFYHEMNACRRAYVDANKDDYKDFADDLPDGTTNIPARYISHQYNRIENDMLATIKREACRMAKTNIYSLCFDGIMTRSRPDTEFDIERIERTLYDRHGIHMGIAIKPMDNTLELPDDLPAYTGLTIDEMKDVPESLLDEFHALYVGMPVIANINRELFKNNQSFTVVRLDVEGYGRVTLENDEREPIAIDDLPPGNNVLLRNDYGYIAITHEELRRNFSPSYAITVYKSQGRTITQPYTIHETGMMDNKGLYVALTRTVDPKMITVICNGSCIITRS